jgi:hypothetical protein
MAAYQSGLQLHPPYFNSNTLRFAVHNFFNILEKAPTSIKQTTGILF